MLTAAYCILLVVTGLFLHTTTSLVFVAASLVATIAGYVFKNSRLVAATGLLLYYPLVAMVGQVAPPVLSVLGTGTFMIVFLERMSFEYSISPFMDGPTAVDEETRSAAARLSRHHALKLAKFVLLATIVTAASLLVAGRISYVPVFVAAALMLTASLRFLSKDRAVAPIGSPNT